MFWNLSHLLFLMISIKSQMVKGLLFTVKNSWLFQVGYFWEGVNPIPTVHWSSSSKSSKHHKSQTVRAIRFPFWENVQTPHVTFFFCYFCKDNFQLSLDWGRRPPNCWWSPLKLGGQPLNWVGQPLKCWRSPISVTCLRGSGSWKY